MKKMIRDLKMARGLCAMHNLYSAVAAIDLAIAFLEKM